MDRRTFATGSVTAMAALAVAPLAALKTFVDEPTPPRTSYCVREQLFKWLLVNHPEVAYTLLTQKLGMPVLCRCFGPGFDSRARGYSLEFPVRRPFHLSIPGQVPQDLVPGMTHDLFTLQHPSELIVPDKEWLQNGRHPSKPYEVMRVAYLAIWLRGQELNADVVAY